MAFNDEFRSSLLNSSQRLGIDPVDLGTVISYETGGTFDPWQRGPTTQWGQHRGLIQWGEPQRNQYGVTQDSSVPDQFNAIEQYLTKAGVKPGMGLLDIYSAVNAGRVGRYNASDANNGGAPGTVADKVRSQMGGHRDKVTALLGQGSPDPDQPAPDAMPTSAMLPANTVAGYAIPGGATAGALTGPRNAPPDYVPEQAKQKSDSPFSNMFGDKDGNWSASDVLIGAGVAFMARDNPNGAAALAKMLNDSQRQPKGTTDWGVANFNSETGRGLYVNKRTGQVEERQFAKPYRTMSDKARADFEDRNEKVSVYNETIGDANKYRNMLANGQIDLSAAAQFASGARKLTDQSNQQDRNAAEYSQFITRLQNAGQRLNAGVQTEGDAVRTLNEIAPKMSKYDNAASIGALDQIIGTSRNRFNSLVQSQKSVYDEFGDQAPRGNYLNDYNTFGQNFDRYDQEFNPRRDAFMRSRDQQPATASDPRVRPAGSQGGGSFSTDDYQRWKANRSGR